MVKKRTDFVSIRRFVLTLPALVLVLLLLAGVFPGGAAFAEGGGDPLALRFVCDETVASVTANKKGIHFKKDIFQKIEK